MIEPLARLGYASKAFIYATVGLLAAAAALKHGGAVTDTRGALRVILSHPFGNSVLFILAVGLCGYAVWRVLDAFLDPERRGTGFKGLVIRIGHLIRAMVYGGLGLEAFRLARGLRASHGTDATVRLWTAKVMTMPMGEWLVGIAGAITAAYGVSEIIDAIKGTEEAHKDLSSLDPGRRRTLNRICRFGVASRALIIVVLGILLVRAAMLHDPGEAAGVRGSILNLAGTGPGTWLLAFTAFGLIAYALDQALHARYGHIRSPLR
jgi:Domain of Unknown Function (DUF1206)